MRRRQLSEGAPRRRRSASWDHLCHSLADSLRDTFTAVDVEAAGIHLSHSLTAEGASVLR